MSAWNFPKLIRPFMEELCERTGESVLLGVLNHEAEVMTYVEIIDSPHPVRYQIPVGTTRPLYASSAGRLLLAFADKPWRDSYLVYGAVQDQDRDPVSARRAAPASWRRIRGEGVSWSIDGYMVGLAAVAGAGVRWRTGRCIASLNIAGPSDRFRNELDHPEGDGEGGGRAGVGRGGAGGAEEDQGVAFAGWR